MFAYRLRNFATETSPRLPGVFGRLRSFMFGYTKRRLRIDDFLALGSWVAVGNGVWILVGTTSALSVVVAVSNFGGLEDNLAKALSSSISSETGLKITYESASVPKWTWGNGFIRLEDVSVECNSDTWRKFCKEQQEKKAANPGETADLNFDAIDVNWTYWQMKIKSVDLSLSLLKWMDGRGIVKDASFSGVRGVVERRHTVWPLDWVPSRRVGVDGDFEIEKMEVSDLLIEVRNPDFRPFTVSVFNGVLPRFRRQWMIYDLMCADSIVGLFDNSLFSLHKPQSEILSSPRTQSANDLRSEKWSKIRQFKISGLGIDHFSSYSTGPLNWITKGTVDVDTHMLIPHEGQTDDMLDRILDEIDGLRASQHANMGPHKIRTLKHIRRYGIHKSVGITKELSAILFISKIDVNDLKASVPIVTPQLTYMSNALIRPVVAYMNANRTKISLNCDAKFDVINFEGAQDVFTAGLAELISEEVGRNLILLASDDAERLRRIKDIGLWGISELSKTIATLLELARFDDSSWKSYQHNL